MYWIEPTCVHGNTFSTIWLNEFEYAEAGDQIISHGWCVVYLSGCQHSYPCVKDVCCVKVVIIIFHNKTWKLFLLYFTFTQ